MSQFAENKGYFKPKGKDPYLKSKSLEEVSIKRVNGKRTSLEPKQSITNIISDSNSNHSNSETNTKNPTKTTKHKPLTNTNIESNNNNSSLVFKASHIRNESHSLSDSNKSKSKSKNRSKNKNKNRNKHSKNKTKLNTKHKMRNNMHKTLKSKKSRKPKRISLQDKQKEMKKITKDHREFELSYDMMVGIRFAVSISEPSMTMPSSTGTWEDTDTDSDGDLESEFQRSLKFSFPSHGSKQTPAHQMRDFKFKDYCPEIFRQLRDWFGIETGHYLTTITGAFKLLEFLSNSKSGSFFFFSHNKQFIIKTMTHSESLFLRKILPHYFKYVSRQPYTLISKFFGMHRVTVKGRSPIYFLIMGSVFYTKAPIMVQYDLKGSTHGRKTKEKEKKEGAILKDLDFIHTKQILKIGPEKAKLFKSQLRNDTEFLRKLKIMDYSLLVGISYRDQFPKSFDEQTESQIQTQTTNNSSNNSSTNIEMKEEIKINNKSPKTKINKRNKESKIKSKSPLNNNNNNNTNSGPQSPMIDYGYEGDSDNQNISKRNKRSSIKRKSKSLIIKANKESDSSASESEKKQNIETQKIESITNPNIIETKPILKYSKSDTESPSNINKLEKQESLGSTSTKVMKPQHYHSSKPSDFDLPFQLPETPAVNDSNVIVPEEAFNIENSETKNDNINFTTKHTKLKPLINTIEPSKSENSPFNDISLNNSSNIDSTPNIPFYSGKTVLRDINEDLNDNEVHYNALHNPFTNEMGGMCFIDENGNKGNEIYFVGLIDILQKYTRKKKMESFLKSLSHDRETISAVDPELYAKRMRKFFADKVK